MYKEEAQKISEEIEASGLGTEENDLSEEELAILDSQDCHDITKEEIKEIYDAIEASELSTEENDLSEEELAVLDSQEEEEDDDFEEEDKEEGDFEEDNDFEEEDEEEEDFEDDEDVEEPVRTEQITIVQQPVVVETSVGAEFGPKGEVRPFARISLKRHLDLPGDDNDTVWSIVASDFDELYASVRDYVAQMKEDLNEN